MSVVHLWDHGRTAVIWCPGCDREHALPVARANRPNWFFNGDIDLPTFSPSILVQAGHHAPGQGEGDCWCNFEARFGTPSPFHCGICHSFVTAGMIQFLPDSTHALSGQTVPLPEWDEAA